MRDSTRRVGLSLALAGIDPRATFRAMRNVPRYLGDRRRFRRLSKAAGTPLPLLRHVLPALTDTGASAGTTGEYFLADLWAARRIRAQNPARHVDVGSRIDGLVAHLLTFTEVDVIDIRPLESKIEGLRFVQSDATTLGGITATSVSSFHALEHFGLGRYGDALDPLGHVKGLRALGGAVAPGGHLYVGYPVGKARVEFNAHRVIDPRLAVQTLDDFELLQFSVVRDGEVVDTRPDDVVDLPYGVGLYHFRRR
jgi:hypothetical protein